MSEYSGPLWTPDGCFSRRKAAQAGGPEPRRCITSAIVHHVAGFGPRIRGNGIMRPLTHARPSARPRDRGRTVKYVQQDTQYPRLTSAWCLSPWERSLRPQEGRASRERGQACEAEAFEPFGLPSLRRARRVLADGPHCPADTGTVPHGPPPTFRHREGLRPRDGRPR